MILAIVSALMIAAIVFVQQAQRRIPVQYAKRVVGRRVMQGQSTFIPIPVNSAGMIPLIFAISIVTAPYIIASYFVFWTTGVWHGIANFFYTVFGYNSGYPIYWIIYFLLVVGFTYFYTAIQFQQQRLPETLQKNGGFIPGYRPGAADGGVPDARGQPRYQSLGRCSSARSPCCHIRPANPEHALNLTISATALLIIVGVVIDTMRQLEAQLMMRNNQSFIK